MLSTASLGSMSMLDSDNIYWVAIYQDGTEVSEKTLRYIDLDRPQLATFQIVGPSGVLHQQEIDSEHSSTHLIWRRRRGLSQSGDIWREWHIVGWTIGPVWAIDTVRMEKILSSGFKVGHPVFYPPQPVQGESFLVGENGLTIVQNRVIVP